MTIPFQRHLTTFVTLLFLSPTLLHAQQHEVLSEHIKTLRLLVDDDWLSPLPVVSLNGSSTLSISFDDLTHDYHRYVYHLERCEPDWQPSQDVFESDWLEGFNDNVVEDDNLESMNTHVLYNHYEIRFPNSRCRIRRSGNYRLSIFDDDDDADHTQPLLTACFMVVEPRMGTSLRVTTDTDADVRKSHQQVELNVSYGSQRVSDPAGQVKVVVLQNGRWDNAVFFPSPTYVLPQELRWTHHRSLIFPAGNEYLKFEMTGTHDIGMNIDRTFFSDDAYHAQLFTVPERRSYTYDEDADGCFLIRNADYDDSDRLCDYEWVHYSVQSPPADGRVYVNGVWTCGAFTPEFELQYNEQAQCYIGSVLQKQGYYSYQFLLRRPDGTTTFLPSQGSFFQTQNKYQALVYYRGPSQRTYDLVGYCQVSFKGA